MGKASNKASRSSAPKSLATRLLDFCRKRAIRHIAAMWLLGFLVLESFLFVDLLRNYNYLETIPRELIFPTAMHMVTALIVAVTVYAIRRPRLLSGRLITVLLITLMLSNYQARLDALAGVFRAVLPLLPSPGNDLGIISVVFLVLIVAAAAWIGLVFEKFQAKHPKLQDNNTIGALVILVAILFFGQANAAYGVLRSAIPQSSTQAPAFNTPADRIITEKPDIYYFVLDRYTNKQVLQSQFDFDNSPFLDHLKNNGFTVADGAYANYPYTAISVASTITANYTKDSVAPYVDSSVQTRALYHNLIYQSPVIRALKQDGYTYYNVGAWYGTANQAPLADVNPMWDNLLTIVGREKRLRGLEAIEYSKSPYYALSKLPKASWPLKLSTRTPLDDTREQLSYLNKITTGPSTGSKFVFAHILVPHEPFYFNSDGSLATNTNNDSVGQSIKSKYIGQVNFINDQMKQIVDNIQKQSNGRAVIVFNSDEGPYPDSMTATFLKPAGTSDGEEGTVAGGDMSKWPTDWLKMKYGTLQAVHIPEASAQDLDSLSGVNIFRIILNQYLGYQLPYLPDCQYALTQGSIYEFRYTDITKRLNPDASSECSKYQTVGPNK